MIFLAGHTDLVLASVPPIPVAAWHPSSMPADETPDQSPRCHFPRNQVVPDVQSKSVGQEKETRPKEIDQKLRSVLEAWIYGCCGMPRDLTAGKVRGTHIHLRASGNPRSLPLSLTHSFRFFLRLPSNATSARPGHFLAFGWATSRHPSATQPANRPNQPFEICPHRLEPFLSGSDGDPTNCLSPLLSDSTGTAVVTRKTTVRWL